MYRIAELTGQSESLNPREVDIDANSRMSSMMSSMVTPMESTGTEPMESRDTELRLNISASIIDHLHEPGIVIVIITISTHY